MNTDDWTLPSERPETLTSPWATTVHRTGDGRYAEAESGTERSWMAWLDEFARHGEQGRPTWSRSPGGTLYLRAGDRFGFLWPTGGAWSAGTAQVVGDLGGEWLLSAAPFAFARRAVEDWWIARQADLAAGVDVDGRLGPAEVAA